MQEWPYRLIKALAFIHRKIDISAEDFKEYYETIHAPLANSLLSLEDYERNYIIQTKNPKFNTLGSISIFKYQSTEALEIIGQEMSSSKGDNLRKDELNFMDVSRNYHLLTETTELTARSFNKKLFTRDGGFPDIFISRGDDTFIRERFMQKYKYKPTPNAIVLHERPTNFFDCLNIFYVESLNGEKLRRVLKPNQWKNNILALLLGFISVLIAILDFRLMLILFIMYLFKSLYNSYINVKNNNKKVLTYMLGYTILKIIERMIKIVVFIKHLPMKTPKINRDLNNYTLIN